MKKHLFLLLITISFLACQNKNNESIRNELNKMNSCIEKSIESGPHFVKSFNIDSLKKEILEFEEILLKRGHLKDISTEQYKSLVMGLISSNGNGSDILNDLKKNKEKIYEEIVFISYDVLVTCPNITIIENESVFSPKIVLRYKTMEELSAYGYKDEIKIATFFETFDKDEFKNVETRVPAMYLVLLNLEKPKTE